MGDDEGARLTLPVGARDHADGAADAAVTLVEYGDYECPHCGRAYPIVKEVQRRLGGRLRFVFRNFPLAEAHPHAEHAAEAAEGAASQGRFWEMHDALFEHQQALDDRHLVGYAKGLGLDDTRFRDELAAHRHAPRVREDFLSGVRSGVNGTPTFFINGIRYDDSWDLAALLEALEAVSTPGRPSRRRAPRGGPDGR
ncbi:MAG TPA: thioredoxin domain-containing protein [Vicinamibacterales bacterium]